MKRTVEMFKDELCLRKRFPRQLVFVFERFLNSFSVVFYTEITEWPLFTANFPTEKRKGTRPSPALYRRSLMWLSVPGQFFNLQSKAF